MQKTVVIAERLAERMYSRRHIWRIQKKIARHTAFFISQENLLRSDAWHALIIVTDSQSWMRTRNGKKSFSWLRKAGGGKVCHITLNLQHSPFARSVRTWRFSAFSAMVFMLHDNKQALFPSVWPSLTKGWLGGDGFAFQLLLKWTAWMYLTMLMKSASRTQTKHKQNNPSPINRNKFPQQNLAVLNLIWYAINSSRTAVL